MVTMKVTVDALNGRNISRFSDLEALGSDATLQEALKIPIDLVVTE